MFKKLITLMCVFTIILSSQNSYSEEKKAWLRDKIKERISKKLQEKPAPEANSDVISKITKSGHFTFKITYKDLTRFYIIHVPKNYKASKPTALVFALHGGGGDMNIQANDEYYKLISKSEKEGFIAVFPNGYSQFQSGNLATWNAGKCCGNARDKKIDDVGFIKEIIKITSQQLNIDNKKIFATGMSNGAMMAYKLACDLPDTFAAIAAVAGTDNTTDCKTLKPISILHIHAKDDDHVLFEGGAGKNAFKDSAQINEFTSVKDTIAKWLNLNSCNEKPERILEKKGAYCERYTKCKNNTTVQLCVTETGGHSWPGGKKPRNVGGSPSAAISANDIIWDFFKSH